MRRVFDGRVHVRYGQAYVLAGGANPELPEAFAGQENGLCGAAVPGSLFLITGLHTGDVGFAVDVHDEPPPIDESWEEIVEATFVATTAEAALVEWGEADGARLDLRPGDWRARYSARGMDAAHDQTLPEDEPPIDHYLLQLWLADPAPDEVVKQTSKVAAYWHRTASKRSGRGRPTLMARLRSAVSARLPFDP
jgi:hypothetical protein